MITTTCAETSDRPLVIITYASVGSGHRSAAQATAQALEDLCGKHPALPENTEIAVLDILDYGYIKFDGDKTANLASHLYGTPAMGWRFGMVAIHVLTIHQNRSKAQAHRHPGNTHRCRQRIGCRKDGYRANLPRNLHSNRLRRRRPVAAP